MTALVAFVASAMTVWPDTFFLRTAVFPGRLPIAYVVLFDELITWGVMPDGRLVNAREPGLRVAS
jgi:hypothetical protein